MSSQGENNHFHSSHAYGKSRQITIHEPSLRHFNAKTSFTWKLRQYVSATLLSLIIYKFRLQVDEAGSLSNPISPPQ